MTPSYQDELDRLDAEEALDPTVDLEASLAVAGERTPDDYVRTLDLADKFGVAPAAVEEHREDFEEFDRKPDVDLDEIRQKYRKTAEYLSNPDNASVSSDDIKSLTAIEESAGPIDWLAETFEGMGGSIWEGTKQAGRGLALQSLEVGLPNLLDFATAVPSPIQVGRKVAEAFGVDGQIDTAVDAVRQQAIDTLAADIAAGEKTIESLTPDDLTTIQEGVRAGVQSTIEMAGSLALSLATGSPAPMLADAYLRSSSLAYASGRNEGLDPNQATTYGGLHGAIEVATELVPAKILTRMFGDVTTGFRRQLTELVFSDVAGEQLATLGQTAVDVGYELDQELAQAETFEDQLRIQGERQFVTLIASLVGSGTQAAAVKTADLATRPFRRRSFEEANTAAHSQFEAQQLAHLVTLSQESRTNERSGARFEQFVDSLGDDDVVYIDAERVQEVLDQGVAVSPEVEAQLQDASAADVVIPLSRFLSNPEFANATVQHARRAPDRKSAAQLKEKGSLDALKTIADQARQRVEDTEALDAAMGELREQLVATGRLNEQDAGDSLLVWESFLTRLMADRGMTAEEALERVSTKIMTPEQADAYRRAKRAQKGEQPAPVQLSEPDFGDLEITEEVTLAESGDTVQTTVKAKQAWEKQTKRRQVLEQLKECLGA